MIPIELCGQTRDKEQIDIYFNGKKLSFISCAFVKGNVFYLPIDERSEWTFDSDEVNSQLMLQGTNSCCLITEKGFFLFDKENAYSHYLIKKEGHTFSNATVLSDCFDATIAWEWNTATLYITNVQSFDGYRSMPDDMLSEQYNYPRYNNVYMYIDGILEKVESEQLAVKTKEGTRIKLKVHPFSKIDEVVNSTRYNMYNYSKLVEGQKSRFCFRCIYDDTFKELNLMCEEIAEINNAYRYKKMLYTKESWNEFSNKLLNLTESEKESDIDYHINNDSASVKVLRKIISVQPDAWHNQRVFKAMLADFLPEDKLRRNLLLISVEEEIPKELERCSGNSFDNMRISIMKKKLIRACGCSESIAHEIVNAWIKVFSI